MSAGPLRGRHVAVVGGGLAGLAAALECADMGARVTLLERRRRLGGLTWSFQHNDLTVDNGQHVYLACCDAYIAFLARIGASDEVQPPVPLDIPVIAPGPHPGAAPVAGRLRRRDLPVPLHLAGSLLAYPHISTADRLKLGWALLGLARLDLDDPRLDRVTFGEWLAARGQSARAVAAVWDLITVPTVNLPAAEASLAVAAMVFKTGLLSAPGAADIGWSRVPLGRLHGEHATRALDDAGVTTLRGIRVHRIVPGEDSDGWHLEADGSPIRADLVISALPHEEAAQVLPSGLVSDQERWPELSSSGIVDVHLVFDRPVTEHPLLAGHRSPVQWVFDRTASSGLDALPDAAHRPGDDRSPGAETWPDAPHRPGDARSAGRQYLAVSLSAADELLGARPEALVRSTQKELARLLPAVGQARLVDSLVTKERRATFRAAPGSNTVRPPAATSRPGLALAGAWTATGWPATMEGAVRSGWSAARSLVASVTTRHPDGAATSSPIVASNSPVVPQEVA